jgi:hypothetical protein
MTHGQLKIVASADVGPLGPREGPATTFDWEGSDSLPVAGLVVAVLAGAWLIYHIVRRRQRAAATSS